MSLHGNSLYADIKNFSTMYLFTILIYSIFMETSVYRKLQRHLDTFPIGFPETQTGVDLRVLKYFFTEKEAEIALHLSILPRSINQIFRSAKHLGYTKEELRIFLDKMVKKHLITRNSRKIRPKYRGDMLAVGLYEYQAENIDKELSELMLEYMEEGFRNEFFRKDTALQLRTIPIEKSLKHANPITTYDNVRDLINKSTMINVGACVCKVSHDQIGQPCQRTNNREWCISLSYNNKPPLSHGKRRDLTKEEAFELLEKAEKEGMVLQPSNSKKPAFICVCCGCCCGVLSEAKYLDNPSQFFESNYFSIVNPELCVGCGLCAKRCNMDAISIIDEKAVVNLHRCIGCGLCVPTCPKNAIKLFSKDKIKKLPANTTMLYLKIWDGKTPKRKILGMALRTILGMKLTPNDEK